MFRFIVLLNLIFISGNSFANECTGFNKSFNSTYEISLFSSQEISIRDKSNPKNLNKVIAVGSSFQGTIDKHSQKQYKLISIKENQITFEFISRFDARSFGGKVKNCTCEITIEI